MANLFKETKEHIKHNHERLKQGKVNCIPFSDNLAKLRKHIPGIIKGTPYIISASSGVGKTQLTKYIFVYEAYKYVKEHPESDISIEIHYFPLEESKEEFMLGMIAKYLSDVHKLNYTTQELEGYYQDTILPEEIINLIDGAEEYFSDLFKYLHIVDNVKNPTGIMKHMRNVATKVGDFYYQGKKLETPVTNSWIDFHYDDYKEHKDTHFVICIVDHISLLDEETNPITKQMMSKHETISKWSADYSRYLLTKKFNQVVVNVQQLAAAGESQQFTNKGESIKERVLPSLDKLADNKLTQRDAKIIIFVFAPYRYGFASWAGYDLNIFKDTFRVIIIAKNRYGKPDLHDYVYFDAVTNTFKELPPALTKDGYNTKEMEFIYKKLKEKNVK